MMAAMADVYVQPNTPGWAILYNLETYGAIDLAREIARKHHTSVELIISRVRTKNVTHARHHLWAVIRWTLDISYPEIARWFGVDHTTVMSGVRNHEARIVKECGGDNQAR